MNKKAAILFVSLASIAAWASPQKTIVSDGFEAPDLSTHWETQKFLPGAVRIQSSVVRAGKGSARITLRSGDQIPQERGSKLERAELRESKTLWSAEDSASEYSFSVFVPQDFPIVSTRLVIAQWKHNCPGDECTPDNPIIAVRYVAGEISITQKAGPEEQVLFHTREDARNRWLDFRFQIRFARNQDGRIKAWLGEAIVVDYKGATAYPASGGYFGRGQFYFKMGLYRDQSPEPMTLYFDEYRKQRMDLIDP